jgi:hypothetical protein
MATRTEFLQRVSAALQVPLAEVRSVAQRRSRGATHVRGARAAKQASTIDAARLLLAVMMVRIEGAATQAAAVMADIERLTLLRHGAQLYFDADFILPEDFIGAVAEILAALADPARLERAQDWIGRIGIARGGGRVAGWIEVRAAQSEEWEDFDYAATPEDMIAILAAPIARRVEVTAAALREISDALT